MPTHLCKKVGINHYVQVLGVGMNGDRLDGYFDEFQQGLSFKSSMCKPGVRLVSSLKTVTFKA